MLLSLIIERRDESYAGNMYSQKYGSNRKERSWKTKEDIEKLIEDMREKEVTRDEAQDRDMWRSQTKTLTQLEREKKKTPLYSTTLVNKKIPLFIQGPIFVRYFSMF
uniref:Uncharacterized protein n=1 Tax=Cacopsylla melanoneura TaxID=428564 RepID=A0A8D8VKZ6_9HEMI